MHEVIVALVIVARKTPVFVQVDCSYLRKVKTSVFIPFYQIFICSDRSGTSCKSKNTVRFLGNLCSDDRSSFFAHVFVVFCYNNAHNKMPLS